MEENRAISEEWENDREATLTYLESHGDDVFDSVVLSASRTGPVLKKTVLDYRYGHYALLGLTEDFVFVYDLKKETVSNYLPSRWPSDKASPSRAEEPGFESRLRRDFFGVESYQLLKNWLFSGYPARRLAL